MGGAQPDACLLSPLFPPVYAELAESCGYRLGGLSRKFPSWSCLTQFLGGGKTLGRKGFAGDRGARGRGELRAAPSPTPEPFFLDRKKSNAFRSKCRRVFSPAGVVTFTSNKSFFFFPQSCKMFFSSNGFLWMKENKTKITTRLN